MSQKAFENCVDIPVNRSEKPREVGLNFAGDWGWEMGYVEGLLEAVGEYLDLVKLAVLTGRLMDREFVKRKVALYNKHQVKVFPGGMTLEAALVCRKVEQFFDEARDLGCSVVEVSESELIVPTQGVGCCACAIAVGARRRIEFDRPIGVK